MPAFLARSDLSSGDLRLNLINDEGFAQDAFKVTWTIYSSDGVPVSGRGLPALKCGVGRYYAPWCAKAVNGNYRIVWSVEEDPGDDVLTYEEKFFVVEPSAYQCCPNFVCDNGQPDPGGLAYLTGSTLGRGDLPIFFKDSSGVPTDPFVVLWTVYNVVGYPMTSRMEATRAAIGEYYADWFVNAIGGDYYVQWEWVGESGDPAESKKLYFSVISPPALVFTSRGNCNTGGATSCAPSGTDCCSSSCVVPLFQTQVVNKQVYSGGGGSCGAFVGSVLCVPPISFPPSSPSIPASVPSAACCPFEVSRVPHFSGALMAGGAFSDQAPFSIPSGVRRVAFYITYTRGAQNGYGLFRLMWGNGTDETQSTLIDSDFTSLSSVASSQDMYLNDLKGPVPTNGNPVKFTLETGVPGGATTVRLLAAEGGATGAPGTVSISLTAASR